MVNQEINRKKSSVFLVVAVTIFLFIALVTPSVSALTDTTNPTIFSVSPGNNEQDVSTDGQITVLFSEYMDSSTINTNTFIVVQRPTPEFGDYESNAIEGTVTYSSREATFTPNEAFSPNQQYGNVFTVTITQGAKDLAGNSLSQEYMWSFTTGIDPFNTGTTTAQLDQTASADSESLAVPTTAVPVETANTFPWVWVIGGLALLLLIAFISTRSMNSDSVVNKNIQTVRSNPFGDVHPVIDIEGIGPEYSEKLQGMGIKNTKQLWEANALHVATETGAPVSVVKGWQHMAELVSVKDIGPQYAELLERSGIHSIDQLKNFDPNKLLKLVRKKQDSLKINIQGNSPGHATVAHWIGAARDHKFSAS